MSDAPTPGPSPEMSQMPFSPPPPEAGGLVGALSSAVDQVTLTCSKSSNPICFSTSISGANLITNLWISLILGALCYLGFIVFRSKFRFYQARLDMPQVTFKPPPLKLHGFHRIWSWLIPVFKISDEELLMSAGMDALIAVRIISFGVLLLLPITIFALAILIPINYLDDYYLKEAKQAGVQDDYTTVFIRLTMSNLTPGSPIMWVHFCFVYGVVFWACWLITEHYKEYITLRQTYVVRSTAVPDGALGGSTGPMNADTTPLLAVRSPMKRKHVLARASSGSELERQGSFGSTGSGKVRRAVGSLRLPRRDASGSSTGGVEVAVNGGEHLNRMSPNGSGVEGLSRPSRLSGASVGAGPVSQQQQQQQSQQLLTPAPTFSHDYRISAAPGYETIEMTAQTTTTSQQQQGWPHSSNAGGGGDALDWTMHDFSKEILPENAAVVPSSGTSSPRNGLPVQQSAAAAPPLQPLVSARLSGVNPVSRMPSNAAVAAALEGSSYGTTSAAEALAMIRHHRALSGANTRASGGAGVGNMTPRVADSAGAAVGGGIGSDPGGLENDGAGVVGQQPSSPQHAKQGSGGAADGTNNSKPAPPADLTRIIQAVTAYADEHPEEGGHGSLATSAALAPSLASPQGQEGVAHRWWTAISTLGNRLERRRSTNRGGSTIPSGHSITFKGAVPMRPLPGGGVVAANASLYTVLVTDQPIERLRLKRPLGNLEFWHERNEMNLLGLQTTNTDELEGAEDRRNAVVDVAGGLASAAGGIAATTASTIHNLGSSLASTRGKLKSQQRIRAAPGTAAEHADGFAPSSPRPADVERGLPKPHNNSTTSSPSSLQKTSSAAAAAAAPSDELPPKRVPARHRGTSVLLDPGATERGIGFSSGWSSTWNGLKNWWYHRGRYREWRRDVRWAMFNKRVRTATEMFSELFGDEFDAIIPIYPTKSVDKLIHEWDHAAAALERAQYRLKELSEAARAEAEGTADSSGCGTTICRPTVSEKKVKKLKDKIASLAKKTSDLQAQISAERDAVLSDLPSTCFFATFKSQEAAAIASQANLNPITQRLFDVQAAPSPDDVNWPALERSWWQRQARPAYVIPLILFIMLLPIGAFTGAFAQLTIAFCGNPENPGPAADAWFCSDDRWAVFFRNLLTSIAPSLLLSLYHLCVLPVLVYYAAQAEGRCFSLSQLDRRCADLFFYWDVFNVFLGAMLGGSVLSELPQYLDNPEAIWSTLSSAIPASSNFFINYVSYRALVMAWFRLFYPHQGTIACILKWLHIIPWAKTARDKALEAPVRNCRYGRDIGIPVLMNFVMVLAYAVVSPLILPFGLIYFVLLWAVWRYQMLYVYQRQYESGGQFWPLVAHKVIGCLLLGVLFTSVVLIFKQAYAQAGIMLVTLPLYLLRFDLYLTNRYDAVVAQVPLMAVHKAGRVPTVDPDLWTPPPLRQGAKGWSPEWSKVWAWWGIPRYTV